MCIIIIMIKAYPKKNKSSIEYILLGLLPYTHENMLLTFKPNTFFDELSKTSSYSRKTLKAAFSRATSQKLICKNENNFSITLKGNQIIQPFVAKKLTGSGSLMVIFDIPEDFANTRRSFRNLLKRFEFKQIQQSVWMSDKDYRKILLETIKEYGVEEWVQLYESARID